MVVASSFSAASAVEHTQQHIRIFESYWDKWNITINAEETERIVLTSKFKKARMCRKLRVYDEVVQDKRKALYLGVVLDRTLYFNPHIRHVLNKAQGILRLVYPPSSNTFPNYPSITNA